MMECLTGVGGTTSRQAILWGRSPAPGPHHIELWRRLDSRPLGGVDFSLSRAPADRDVDDGTWVQPLGPETGMVFEASTDYGYRVTTQQGEMVGEGNFRTAPEGAEAAPDRLCFALMSCNQPFAKDGTDDERSLGLISRTPAALRRLDVERVLMLGDQMYADLPEPRSLFDEDYFPLIAPHGRESILECTSEEVRRIYQDRHRLFWSLEAMREIQANWACTFTIDDHEILDNFGSAPDHATRAYAALREGALEAAFDYQTSRAFGRVDARPAHFGHGFHHGPVSLYNLDLRSEKRNVDGNVSMFSLDQYTSFIAFLRKAAHQPVLLIASSVPLLHIPDWLVNAGVALTSMEGDAADRWSYEGVAHSRALFLQALYDHRKRHPKQIIILLGGDVHVGFASELHFPQGDVPPVYQLVSSAVTNRYSPVAQYLASLLPKATGSIGDFLDGEVSAKFLEGEGSNPYGDLNFGTVEVTRDAKGYDVRLQLHGVVDDDDVQVVYDSGPLR